jgi:HSP20 family protein
MAANKETALAPGREPVDMRRWMPADLSRTFALRGWPLFRFPTLRTRAVVNPSKWFPEIDVFEKDDRLITKIDLPGMTKQDIRVEVTDGHLVISGERKTEAEEQGDRYYHCERVSGSFSRAVPLPDGVKFEDVAATFCDGVLEVSVPLPGSRDEKIHQTATAAAPNARTAVAVAVAVERRGR